MRIETDTQCRVPWTILVIGTLYGRGTSSLVERHPLAHTPPFHMVSTQNQPWGLNEAIEGESHPNFFIPDLQSLPSILFAVLGGGLGPEDHCSPLSPRPKESYILHPLSIFPLF
jgi:hypothetical protein